MYKRRTLLRLGACAATVGVALPARAAYPERVVKVIVPFAAGAGTDIVVRLIGSTLERELGTRLVFENRAGAGGDIGSEFAARSAPDGYTIMVSSTNLILGPILRKDAKYNFQADFVPIARFATAQLVMVAHPERVGVRSIREMIEASRRDPGRYNFGAVGAGSPPDLLAEILRLRSGLQYTAVPYKGMAPALVDLLAGNIHFTIPSLLAVKQHIDAGRLRAIAITGAQRMAIAPAIPTFAESGVETAPMNEGTWWGLFAPTGTPAPIVTALSQAVNRTLTDPETRKKLEGSGYAAAYLGQEAFAEELKREDSVWRTWAPQLRT